MNKISIFNAPITNISTSNLCDLPTIFNIIKTDKEIEKVINKIRITLSKQERNFIKTKELQIITFSGEFSKRNSDSLIKHSNLICIDIDNLTEIEMKVTREELKKIEKDLVAYFISPSGIGYKIILRIDSTKFSQADNYLAAISLLKSKIDIPIERFDTVCKDVARACFISHDKDAYLNYKTNDENLYLEIPLLETEKWLASTSNKVEQFRTELAKPSIVFNPLLNNSILNFQKKDDKSNFNILLSMAIKNKGEYVVGNRHNFVQGLSSYCNQFGISKNIVLDYVIDYFLNHEQTLIEGNVFDISKELIPIIEDTYTRYSSQFNTWVEREILEEMVTPTFPVELFKKLPQFISAPLKLFAKGRDADVFLMGMLGVLSNCMPKIGGLYDNKLISANLYVVVSAPASSGKGNLIWARKLANEFVKILKNKYAKELENYECELQKYLAEKKENADAIKPTKPLKSKFIIAGNISSAAIMSAINANNHFGLIFETEADSLVNTLNNKEWGGFSDVLRKAFHNECISSSRKKDDEDIEIERPYLSMVLSGTPNQITRLVSSIENGFFSRILFYDFPNVNVWKDVFEEKSENLEKYFEDYAINLEVVLAPYFYDKAENNDDVVLFEFTEKQKVLFNEWFATKQTVLSHIYGDDFIASVRRLGVCFFRIAMILAVMRHIENYEEDIQLYKKAKKITCSDIDYNNAEMIINTLIYHTIKIYTQVKATKRNKFSKAKKELLLDKLPTEFNRAKAMELASFIGIKEKTAENYIAQFITQGSLQRLEHNQYTKVA
jgi:hypothetical protein